MKQDCIFKPNQDWKHIRSLGNAVVWYGDYVAGDLVSLHVRCIMELPLGDTLLFIGSVICY